MKLTRRQLREWAEWVAVARNRANHISDREDQWEWLQGKAAGAYEFACYFAKRWGSGFDQERFDREIESMLIR